MAKGPHNDKTSARAQTGSSKSGSSKSGSSKAGLPKSRATKSGAAKSQAAKKPVRKSAAKQPSRAQSAATKSTSTPKSRSSSAELSKTALRAAFEKAMRGRGLDEAEDAFDDALEDLYGEDLAESGFSGAADDEALGDAPLHGFSAGSAAGSSSGLGGGFQSGEIGNLLDFYSRMLNAQGGTGEDVLNEMTQGFGMVLGSGPAFAALESMLSNVSAQGAVLMNAVQTQRQLDQIGLCCTSECVKQLMSLNNGYESD